MRAVLVIVLCACVAAGCGSGESDYVDAACGDFVDAAFDGQVSVDRARALYGELKRRLDEADPGDDERAAHRVIAGFAGEGEKAFTMSPAEARRAPTVDLRLSVGPDPQQIRAVRDAGLTRCADLLDGRDPDPEAEVIPSRVTAARTSPRRRGAAGAA